MAIVVAAPRLPPHVSMAPLRALRFSVAFTLFGAGMHYLVTGRKEGDFGRIATGAVLTLASLLFL
ncbi:MAG: hypothetical protein ACHQ49_14520 [Elusimicrobiota bacterium]